MRLIWNYDVAEDWQSKIQQAANGVKNSDVAIIVVGIQEGEFQDRAILSLPGHQEEMIKQISAIGKPVIVVLIGGSAITMNNWIKDVHAILDAWYPGEEGGNAVADILFGDYNPSGRLPITFPVHEGQLPLVYNHKPTGRGDDYNNLSGEPLFPFGFGLSYSQFDYKNIRLEKQSIKTDEVTKLFVTIKNAGALEGDEVVQLYINDELATVARPVMELKGFQRVHLAPQEEREIYFTVTPEMLSMLDKDLKLIVEPGDFRLMIGASSKDIRQVMNLNVK
ncbi:MAG: glycoside hydrolase family 3 C-terminal domain-containing protein [Cyclobacteriaceae bacterium]